MEPQNNFFHYTYSAKQQEEIQHIREKYLPKAEDKMEQLRRLDRSATKKGTIVSVALGVIGCLVMGIGMCCTMVWDERFFLLGVIFGLLGIALVVSAYPLFSYITKKQREKLAPQILKLTEELSKPE